MSKGSANIQAFQVLEPENKPTPEYQGPNYEGKWDPRLITFCITNFVINVGVSQIAPFYPDLAAKEAGLNYTQIGIVFGINPLGSIVFSLVIGSLISVWGRRKCMVGALIAQCMVLSLFGCLNYMTDHKNLFFIMSMFTRICQGASRSVYSTVTFAYVPLFWANEFQKKLAIMETMTALGLLFGPMIGSVLNSFLGYSAPFFMIGAFFLCSIIPIMLLLPSDKSLKQFQAKKKLPIGKAFTSVKTVVTIINIMTITCGYLYFNPFFVNHMAAFGLSTNVAAFIMTIPSFFYILNVNIVPRLQKHCKKSFLMSLALLICFAGNMLEAPFFGTNDNIYPVVFGLMCVGFAQAFSTLPSIPQLMEFLAPVVNDPTMKAGLSDMSAALFIMSLGLGSLIGPLVGGSVYDAFGGNVDAALFPEQEKTAFMWSLIILGFMQLFVGIIFFIFGEGYKGWQDAFRRCSSGYRDDETKPLIPKSQDSENDGVLSDNDSTPETEISQGNIQSSGKQIKITREKL